MSMSRRVAIAGVLGLGLALSRQTALDHGGDLWIEEAASISFPKSGARFRLRLPCQQHA